MSNKKKKWFQKGSWAGSETNPSLFGNTIKKHSENLKKQGLLDEDGFEILPEDDYGYSSYSWDLDKKLLNKNPEQTGDKKLDKENKYKAIKSEYYDSYSSYEKTGHWGGYSYYRQPQLTYKYVQQMANALSAQHNIKVQVGDTWNVDLLNRTLTYNPASLIYGTKSELLATLMHEIGKLRYCAHSSLLKNKYITMYKMPALEVLSTYEDLRTDFLMLKAYESASEIYESIIPQIEEQVKRYMKHGEAFRDLIERIPQYTFQNIVSNHMSQNGGRINPEDPALKQELHKVFGTTDIEMVKIGLQVVQTKARNNGSIFEYCGEMLALMYDLDDQKNKKFENIQDKIAKTLDTIEPSKKQPDSQALVDYLDKTTYPIVEDLLKETQDGAEAIKKAFPNMSEEVLKNMMREIEAQMGGRGGNGVNVQPDGNVKTRRASGPSDEETPPEWGNGEYRPLKDSVSMEIKQLVNRLTFLRREELTVRYQADQKRGRLNSRKLYKSSTGSRRLFKKKLENVDTIQSFAFSILLDVSGSMSGKRIIHCTRALIILSEVFKKMNIPFEIVTFSDGTKTIKPFGRDMDKKMEKSIAGLPNNMGGGTNLNRGLDALSIHKQTEKNKVVVVLTDGGVGGVKSFDQRYFIPWAKQGIKSVGFGIECEREMADLCQGNSKVLKNATQLPVEFSNLLKSLIRKR